MAAGVPVARAGGRVSRARSLVLAVVVAILVAGAGSASAATRWAVPLAAGSKGQARSRAVPSAPASPTATCTSASLKTVRVTWTPVALATSYSVHRSTTSSTAGFAVVATGVIGTSWTSGDLAAGGYWFKVVAVLGTNWAGALSAATAKRTTTAAGCS